MDRPGFAVVERKVFIRDVYIGLNYPFKPAATYFGSLSGIAAAVPERTSWECCLESSDVSRID